jgi:hypothetical protein
MKQPSVQFCPVPGEQQPVNEYQQLRESCFFRWATFPQFKYARNLAYLWVGSGLMIAPIAAASFPPQTATVAFLLSTMLGAGLLVGAALLRLYLGWSYIGHRLKQEKIVYEESGWYDGQVWEKPPEVLNRDRLIFAYEVKPILQRLQKSGLILMGAIASGSLVFLWI